MQQYKFVLLAFKLQSFSVVYTIGAFADASRRIKSAFEAQIQFRLKESRFGLLCAFFTLFIVQFGALNVVIALHPLYKAPASPLDPFDYWCTAELVSIILTTVMVVQICYFVSCFA
jgi:hypothetical protein